MAHIQDLHSNILRKVLEWFCIGLHNVGTIHQFKQLLPPAAVCRVWRECMLPYVYRIAYLEYHIKETDKDSEIAQGEYEWKSNIDLILSQRFNSVVKELRVQSFECSLKFSDMIHVLDAFGFSSNHWRAINALYINTGHGILVRENTPSSSDDESFATHIAEYFGRHTPNIGDLFIQTVPRSDESQLLLNKLVNLYISQLHTIYCDPSPLTFNCRSFSSRLRHLRVSIAPGVTNRFPKLLASPLETLLLRNIPHNFTWQSFVGIAPDHIEFTNLRRLVLMFHQPPENAEEPNSSNKQMGASTVSFNIGCRKLFFPVLEQLNIFNSPYNDGALYSVFAHSPLQRVDLYGSFKSIKHTDPRILFNAAIVRFNIHSVSPEDNNDYVDFYCKLLSTPSNITSAWLRVYQSNVPLPLPSTIEWPNLKGIALDTNIHLFSLVQVITQLPKLLTIQVENIVDEANEAGANLQAILQRGWTQTPPIATNVKSLSIYYFRKLPLVFSLDVMCYLTVFTHSLDAVTVPDVYVSDVKEFATNNANAFPHLRNIRVTNKPWWCTW